MAFTNLLGLAYAPVRYFFDFLHHSSRWLPLASSSVVKVHSTPHTETLKQLHPFLDLPYNSTFQHFFAVVDHSPEMLFHYHFIAKKNVESSAETRLLQSIREKLVEEETQLKEVEQALEMERKVYSPTVQCLLHEKDRCTTKTFGQYEYSICVGGEAKQDSVRLGTWKIEVEKDYAKNATVVFKEGQRCWNGIERSLTVHFECGKAEEITSLTEPSTCVYQAVMKSPCFCTEDVVNSIENQLV